MSERRKLRVVMSAVGGAVPAIVATLLVPAIDACGARSDLSAGGEASADASLPADTGAGDAADDVPLFFPDAALRDAGDSAPAMCPTSGVPSVHIVEIPPPGVPADPGQICAVAVPPVASNTAARVTLTAYAPNVETAVGFIAIPPALAAVVVGSPTVTVTQTSIPAFASMTVANMQPTNGGYTFRASWPPLPHPATGAQMTVKTAFTIRCADGGTQTVESLTRIDFCVDGATFDWVSSGDACTVCTIIAEMAPSPIASNNQGDDLPLGRVVRIRVVEIARAERSVLMLAENDAGDGADYEWRVSGGRIETIAPDVVLWTPDDDDARPYGQVAVWNDDGAAVENFLWGAS